MIVSGELPTIETWGLDGDLVACVARVREGLAGRGRPDLLEWLDGLQVDRGDMWPTIIVAGETKRGKSTFVNTLLGHPDLSPAGLNRATNVFVRFWHTETERVDVHTVDGEAIRIAAGDLALWATEEANPENERDVAWIDIGVPSPFINGLLVADTPGVGGLHAAHAEVTLKALASADMLVFVVDSSSPLTEPELTFLDRAAQRIESLAIVMTKRDRHRGWREIQAENKSLIERHAPQLRRAPMFALSSTRAVRTDPEAWSRWGFEAVEQMIAESVFPAAKGLRQRNLVRGHLSALTELDREIAASQAIDQSVAARERLADCQRAVVPAKRQGAAWRQAVEATLVQVTEERLEQLHQGLNEIRKRHIDLIQRGGARDTDEFAKRLQCELIELAGRLDEMSNKALVAAVAPIADALDQATSLSGLAEIRTMADKGLPFAVPLPSEKRDRLVDHLATAQTASSGRYLVTNMVGSVGGLFGSHGAALGLAALGPATGFMTLPLAALYAALIRKGRKTAAYEAELRSWTNEQVNEASFRLSNDFRRALATARTQIIEILDQQLLIRDQRLERLATEAAATAAESVEAQERRAKSSREWRRWITPESRTLEAFLNQAHGPVGAGDPTTGI